MDVKTVLNSAELVEENGQYYISAKYTVEDEHAIKEIIIPRIKLPFCAPTNTGFTIDQETESWCSCRFGSVRVGYSINTGSGILDLDRGKIPGYSGEYYLIERIIEEKKVDLTIEEIEEKLGYKIRVVGEKNT